PLVEPFLVAAVVVLCFYCYARPIEVFLVGHIDRHSWRMKPYPHPSSSMLATSLSSQLEKIHPRYREYHTFVKNDKYTACIASRLPQLFPLSSPEEKTSSRLFRGIFSVNRSH